MVDANNEIVFTHTISKDEWAEKKNPTQGTNGKTTLQVPVKNVTAGTKYSVYFLANTASESPLTDVFTSNNKFATEYSKANNFAMFNQNDADVKGNSHTVVSHLTTRMQILQQRLAALSISSVSQHVLMSQSLRHLPLSLTL